MSMHAVRFPNEPADYRAAREELLRAELDLRRRVEEVAALRRRLPLGGAVPEDYVFEEAGDGEAVRRVRLSELFVRPEASLLLYNFMYGPKMATACPMCTSFLDALDGIAPHVMQRMNLAVVAKSPVQRIRAHARERGWRHLRLLSSAGNAFNRDYVGENPDESQNPLLHVFVRRGAVVHHFYTTELAFAPTEPGQHPRHIDPVWPLWNLFDLTPEGRGEEWYPKLRYER
jgi:predicted dithiol-disulfide oxidoreductase (DUF899 family)